MSALLSIQGLSKHYPIRRGMTRSLLHAVDGVDLIVGEGECVGLVGESGCGKSTLARLAARLIAPTSGAINFAGVDIVAPTMRQFNATPERSGIQVVFQDPNESLNPSFTAFRSVADSIRRLTEDRDPKSVADRVYRAFDDVDLPRELAQRYPHQLSGGQKARVGIARAIVVEPRLLILDEPTSALDASVQSVTLKLLGRLRAKRGMSYLFVSHDLEVVRLISDRIVVMYLGKIIESGPTERIFAKPSHPYTRALMAASPDPARRGVKTARLEGSASSPIDPNPHECRFAGRCPIEIEHCRRAMPHLLSVEPEHVVACHMAHPPEQPLLAGADSEAQR
jgi:oligopeptide/dipeptide ABC transporter ATP-binding protein